MTRFDGKLPTICTLTTYIWYFCKKKVTSQLFNLTWNSQTSHRRFQNKSLKFDLQTDLTETNINSWRFSVYLHE